MSDSTTPQDGKAMSPASTGSLAERPLGDPEIAVEILRLRVAELEQAIRRLAEQDATLSVCEGNVTVTMDATLTDAEREVLEWLAIAGDNTRPTNKTISPVMRAIVRGLLERHKGGGE